MRITSFAITLACASALGCASAPVAPRPPAQPRLQLGASWSHTTRAMVSTTGGTATIEGVSKAKGTLVVFTCNHCPWSKAWEARITDIAKVFSDRGIGTIALNPNDPDAFAEDGFAQMQERAIEAQMDFPYVVDEGGLIARAFGVQKTPEVFLFDAQGRLVYVGAVDDSPHDAQAVKQPYLMQAMLALIAGRAIDPAETMAFGCAIQPKE